MSRKNSKKLRRNSAWEVKSQKKNRKAIRQKSRKEREEQRKNKLVEQEYDKIVKNTDRLWYAKLEEHVFNVDEIMSMDDKTFNKALLREKKLAVKEYRNMAKMLSADNQSRKTLQANLGRKLTDQQYLDFVDVVDSSVWEKIQELIDIDSDVILDLIENDFTYQEAVDTLQNFLDENENNTDVDDSTLLNYLLEQIYGNGEEDETLD